MRRFKKHLKSHHFLKIWTVVYPSEVESLQFTAFTDFDATFEEQFEVPKKKLARIAKLPELEFFFQILLVAYLLHAGRALQVHYTSFIFKAYSNSSSSLKASTLAAKLFGKVQEVNKKHFEQLSALVYFYYAHTQEL